jgi:beta-lactamase class A
MIRVAIAAGLVAALASAPLGARSADLQSAIERIVAGFTGQVGVAVRNIETGETVEVNGAELFPMASTYKVAIMAEVFKQAEEGRFGLSDRVEVTAASKRPGSGLLAYFEPGVRPTIHDLVLMMMSVSDNTATDLLLNRVGATNVTASMRALGLNGIRIDRTTREIIGDYNATLDPRLRDATGAEAAAIRRQYTPAQIADAATRFSRVEKDVTPAHDMTLLLAKIYKGEVVSRQAGEQMMDVLSHNQIMTRLQRHLPDNARLYSKYGSIGGSLNDVGILFVRDQHIAISVYVKDNRADRYVAEDVIGRIARAVFDYYFFAGSSPTQ